MERGTIEQIDIEETMRTSYLDYAMSVIVSRALPDARDGLKPVHRRIMYAMYDMGLRSASGYKKSARIVGEVLGKYHPHGDVAVYEAMARMAQDFSMRYPLVDGQGNFGSIDGDPPAAMRYTEARMSAISEEMLTDIHKDTVDLSANFDDTLQEPSVLPSRLPNLLLNGSSGIAVGMATNIAPHNLNELCEAIVYLIDQYAFIDEVTAQDLMQFVHGPDFPTGGLIVGGEEIENAYATGKGRITLRAVTHVEEIRGNRQRIVVTELPYQVNKSNLLERIADLVRDGRIEDITDLRDESDRRGMSIVIELKRGAEPHQVLSQLFKYTQLQMTFGYNCLALVDGTPRTLSLKQALHVYVEHRREVIVRRSQFDLERARDRAHILEGLRVALDHIEAIIATILDSPDAETARVRLSERFALSERQAHAILDMPLRRLAGMERQRIEDEYAEVIQEIAYLEDLLANPFKILYLVREDVQELAQKYGDARRTHIAGDVENALLAHGLVPDVPVLISITRQGFVKRTPVKAYSLDEEIQVEGGESHEPDPVLHLLAAGSLNDVLFFTHTGRVYLEKVYQIPEGGRADRGILLRNSIRLQEGERVIRALPVSDFESDLYLVMVTGQGKVKRAALGEFVAVRANGVMAFSLDEGDELGWVFLSDGRRDVLLVTAAGKALRFAEEDVRVQGRTTSGVLGIRLDEADRVVGAELAEEGRDLVLITENGFGKRTPMGEFPAKGRNTGGVIALHPRYTDQTGPIVSACVAQPDDRLALVTDKGVVLRIQAAQVPESGRSARGQIVMNVHKGDRVSVVGHIQSGVILQGKGS